MKRQYFHSNKLREYLNNVLRDLYVRETDIFTNKVHERAVVFRYGFLLNIRIKSLLNKLREINPTGIYVDSEYNKMTDPETLETHTKLYGDFYTVLEEVLNILHERKYLLKDQYTKIMNDTVYKSKQNSKRFMPDILVHRRGLLEGRYNHIMLEFKFCSSIYSTTDNNHHQNLIGDIVKLSLANGEQFQYEFTGFVRLCQDNLCMDVIIVDFRNLTEKQRYDKIADYIQRIRGTCHQNLQNFP